MNRENRNHSKVSVRGDTVNILIFLDDPLIKEVLINYLKSKGYSTYLISSSISTLRNIKRREIDLIIADFELFEKAGLELLSRVNQVCPDLPKIIIAGDNNLKSALRAVRDEAFLYIIRKPISDLEEVDCGVRVAMVYNGILREREELSQKLAELEQLTDKIKKQLNESETRFERLVENTPDVIYRIDVQAMAFQYVSPSVESVLNYSLEQLKAMGVEGFISRIHPFDTPTIIEFWSSINKTDSKAIERYSFQYRFMRPDGEIVWLVDNGSLIFDEMGRIVSLEGIISDITPQKCAAEQLSKQAELIEQEVVRRTVELAESETRYRMLLSEAGDIIFTCDEFGNIIDMNRRGEELLDKTVVELNECNWINTLNEVSRRRFKKALSQCFKDGIKPEPFQIEVDTPVRGKLYFEIQSSPVLTEGKVTMALNLARDITIRRKFIQTIRSLKDFNEGIIRTMSEGILIEDEEGKCKFVNPALAKMLGCKVGDLIGKRVLDLIPSTERDYVINQNEIRWMNGSNRFETLMLDTKGENVPVLISSRTLYEKNHIVGALSVITDLRFIKEMENRQRLMENLIADERRLSDIGMLVAGIAHNIASPLFVVSSFAQTLYNKFPDLNELKIILEQVDKIEQITRNMVLKARNEQDKNVRCINLNEVLETELKFLEANLFFKSKVEKEVILDKSIPPIDGVYSDFSQAFVNIINNAIDAMYDTPKRKMRIQTKRVDKEIFIEFEDNGCGIPEKNLAHIFDPFFTTKPKIGEVKNGTPTGTGLGLSTTHQIIKHYNGRIEVESKVGQGTLFRIVLPIPSEYLASYTTATSPEPKIMRDDVN